MCYFHSIFLGKWSNLTHIFHIFPYGWKPTTNSRNVWVTSRDLGQVFSGHLMKPIGDVANFYVSLGSPYYCWWFRNLAFTSWELLTNNISVYLRVKNTCQVVGNGTSGSSTVRNVWILSKTSTIFQRRTQESGIHITECFFRISDS